MRSYPILIIVLLAAVIGMAQIRNPPAPKAAAEASPSPSPSSSAAPAPAPWAQSLLNDLFKRIESDKALQADAKKCPFDLMPAKASNADFDLKACRADPLKCLRKCDENDASSCYSLAVVLEVDKKDTGIQEHSGPLHLRACKLGYISGCTNRAAGILHTGEEDKTKQKCVADTFEKACGFNDPWGCAMHSLTLVKGIGREIDLDKALEAAKKSCDRFGDTDPACQAGKNVIEAIEKQKKQP